jgi:hypothetical protein
MSCERVNSATNFTRSSSKLIAKFTLAAALSSGLAMVTAVPQAWGQAANAAGRSDSEIQSDVAYALSNSSALKGQPITAATIEGNVTISGNVRDDASKELAESVIGRVNGVRSVTNNIIVGAANQTQQGQAQQAPIQQGPAVGGDNTAQGADPNPQQDDPNYDPAQQNMAPAGSQDQSQNGAVPPPQQGPNQPTADQQSQYPPAQYPQSQGPQYGNQPGYPAPPPSYNQQQSYSQQQAVPVTVPSGTLLQVRTSEPLDATHVQPGQVFQATVAADVYQGNVLAIPRGAVITGKVLSTQSNKGDLAGKQGLVLGLGSINLAGQNFTLATDTWYGQGPGKGAYSAGNTVGTAGLGAIIGAIAGGGAGAAIGAGAGAIVGAGASAATTGPRMFVPVEAVLNFHLTAPVTVTPVSPQEAQRLASNSGYPQQPRLRPRGPYPYGYYPPPPPPGYYYGPRYPVAYSPYYYYRY